jgi:hypothetical protein
MGVEPPSRVLGGALHDERAAAQRGRAPLLAQPSVEFSNVIGPLALASSSAETMSRDEKRAELDSELRYAMFGLVAAALNPQGVQGVELKRAG